MVKTSSLVSSAPRFTKKKKNKTQQHLLGRETYRGCDGLKVELQHLFRSSLVERKHPLLAANKNAGIKHFLLASVFRPRGYVQINKYVLFVSDWHTF